MTMKRQTPGSNNPINNSRLITDAVLFIGSALFGVGIGLAVGHPGVGLFIGVSAWLVVMSLLHVGFEL